MKLKKCMVFTLLMAMVITSFLGCSEADKNPKEKVAMGRYVEKTIKMPEAVVAKKEIAYLFEKNPKGELELYCGAEKAKEGETTIQYTKSSDNNWIRSVPKWLNKDEMEISSITYAPDGTKYAIGIEYKKDKVKVHILMSSDNKEAKEIAIDDYKKAINYINMPNKIEVMKDGSIILMNRNIGFKYIDGKKVSSFEIGDINYTLNDNKMLCLDKKLDGGMILDVTTGKKVADVPIQNPSYENVFTTDHSGNWYMVSDKGISRMVKDGSSWETIVDGALASMSMPSLIADRIITGEKDDFYIMYESNNGYRQMKHYLYDKNTPTLPSKTLSIVSLRENITIRQAIALYQQKNQDVKVDYRALMGEEDATTASDYIKTINTELLAGKGADIILLDGMPVDSYIEKGVLDDLSEIVNPLMNSGDVLRNVMDNYKKNGKIFAAPIRFDLTFAYGNRKAVEATKSIEALAEYAKNEKKPILGSTNSYKELTSLFYRYYSNSFIHDGKGLNKEELINFLKALKIISNQTKAVKDSGPSEEDLQYNSDGALALFYKNAVLDLVNVSSMYGIYCPIKVLDEVGGTYATINKQFIPKGLLGINKNSKQKNIAKDFITNLYGEEVQKADLGDGFPINTKALRNFGLAYDDLYMSFNNELEVTQPSKEKMQSILALCENITTPVNIDQVLLDMILSETKSYLSGDVTAESTADKIIEKTKAYLEE